MNDRSTQPPRGTSSFPSPPKGERGRGEGVAREGEVRSLHPLGLPRAIRVRTDVDSLPLAVARDTRGSAADFRTVEQIDEAWRVAEAWWRPSTSGEGLARTYYRVILAGGRPLTLFRDDEDGQWYEQHY